MAICPEISGILCYDTKCWLFNLPKCGVTGFQGMCQSTFLADFCKKSSFCFCEKNVIRDTNNFSCCDCAMFAARKF